MPDMLISAWLQDSDSVVAEIQVTQIIQLLEPAVPSSMPLTDDVPITMSEAVAPYSMPYTDGTVIAQFDHAELYDTPIVQRSVHLIEIAHTEPVEGEAPAVMGVGEVPNS